LDQITKQSQSADRALPVRCRGVGSRDETGSARDALEGRVSVFGFLLVRPQAGSCAWARHPGPGPPRRMPAILGYDGAVGCRITAAGGEARGSHGPRMAGPRLLRACADRLATFHICRLSGLPNGVPIAHRCIRYPPYPRSLILVEAPIDAGRAKNRTETRRDILVSYASNRYPSAVPMIRGARQPFRIRAMLTQGTL
jgi:hypothetical protein